MHAGNFTRNLKHQSQPLNNNSTFWVLGPFLTPLYLGKSVPINKYRDLEIEYKENNTMKIG